VERRQTNWCLRASHPFSQAAVLQCVAVLFLEAEAAGKCKLKLELQTGWVFQALFQIETAGKCKLKLELQTG
jgi:hypothetical protein